jgi:tripeptidyl-peptidase-1
MGILSTLLTAAVAAQAVLASPISARSPYTVKETHYAPREWTKMERANGESVIELQIGLKQGNFDELERHLYEGKTLPCHLPLFHDFCPTSTPGVAQLL